MNDVPPDKYLTIIREMIRHENDVTNHRIMWLLIGQGFIANAYASARPGSASADFLLPLVGILVTLSAFRALYHSYQARGYLLFLAMKAQEGSLKEEQLPFVGWPRNRIPDWWKRVWISPCLAQKRDLLDPWIFLPYVFMVMWLTNLPQYRGLLGRGAFLIGGLLVSAIKKAPLPSRPRYCGRFVSHMTMNT
jgi:hypothetical protein